MFSSILITVDNHSPNVTLLKVHFPSSQRISLPA